MCRTLVVCAVDMFGRFVTCPGPKGFIVSQFRVPCSSRHSRLDESPDRPGMFLVELLETCPHYLGDQEDLGDLPFMFKVLSIDKALSIQVYVYEYPFSYLPGL